MVQDVAFSCLKDPNTEDRMQQRLQRLGHLHNLENAFVHIGHCVERIAQPVLPSARRAYDVTGMALT